MSGFNSSRDPTLSSVLHSGSILVSISGTIVQSGSQFVHISGTLVESGSLYTHLSGTLIVSGALYVTLSGSNIVSGSFLTTLSGSTIVSGSLLTTLSGSTIVSGSLLTMLSGSTILSGALLTTLSGSTIVSGSLLTSISGAFAVSGSIPVNVGSSVSLSAIPIIGGTTTYYAKPSGSSNSDATTAFSDASNITIAGMPFTFTQWDIISVRQIRPPNSITSQPQTDIVYTDVSKFGVSGQNVYVSGSSFEANDQFIVTFSGQQKAYDSTADTIRLAETDPVDEHYVEEECTDTLNLSGVYRYPSDDGMSMGSYNHLAVQWGMSDTDGAMLFYVEGTLDDASSPDWINITRGGYSFMSNSYGNSAFRVLSGTDSDILSFTDLHVKKVRFVLTASSNTNAIQIHIKRSSL